MSSSPTPDLPSPGDEAGTPPPAPAPAPTSGSAPPPPPRRPPIGEHWSALYAYGLPSGSVRALLTIAILGTSCGLLVVEPEQPLPGYLRDLMFLILGHYFALRRGHGEPLQAGPPPLFLPKGSIRVLIIAGFATVVALLIRQGAAIRPSGDTAASALPLVLGFLIGVLSRAFGDLMERLRGRPPYRIFSDFRATIVLLCAVAVITLAWNHVYHFLPSPRAEPMGRVGPLRDYGLEHLLGAVVGFYFGARS